MIRSDSLISYAPIVIHTYTRVDYLQKTIESLLQNDLAKSTDIFIASDGPRNPKDENGVLLVRSYIKLIKGFKSVTAIYRNRNYGYHQNAILAFNDVYQKFDRLISIEDDTIVGKGFLKFINDGLSIYRDDRSVFAVCGYLDNSVTINHPGDAVLLTGFAAWGFGIWKDRFYEIPNHIELASEFLSRLSLFSKLNLTRPGLAFGVWQVANGRIEAGDLVSLLHIIKTQKKCLFPSKSLVRNIGNDGTGENCIIDISYQTQPYNNLDVIFINPDKNSHVYQSNPFFSSFGGWRALIIHLFKFLVFIVLGESIYKRLAGFKNSIRYII